MNLDIHGIEVAIVPDAGHGMMMENPVGQQARSVKLSQDMVYKFFVSA